MRRILTFRGYMYYQGVTRKVLHVMICDSHVGPSPAAVAMLTGGE